MSFDKKTIGFLTVLIVFSLITPVYAYADNTTISSPKITLNSSDPFEFRTMSEKQQLLDKAEEYPEKYDLRDEACVTPVKLQNPFGSCWGFAAIGAAETSILGSGLAAQEGYDANTLDLSEKHLAYFASSYLDDPSSSQNGEGTHHWEGVEANEIMDIGGNPILATNTYASGTGPVYERRKESEQSIEDLEYKGKKGIIDKRYIDGAFRNYSYSAEDDWSLDNALRFKQSFVLKESFMLPDPADINQDTQVYTYNPAGTAAIKEQLYKKRGVEVAFCADTSSPNQEMGEDGVYLSTSTWSHYTWEPADANHAVQIVGWDDNYSRDNFISAHRPPEDMFPDGRYEGATNGGNGAWLVKNSWGSGEVDFPNKGEGNWGIVKNGVHTGYFWISYYDQSLCSAEALLFDKANTSDGYYLDQYDFMQAHDMWAADQTTETSMANVFQAEVCEELEAVSCQTTHPATHVSYEIYLLQDDYQNPEDGVLVARMEESYEYGGFHKKDLEPCGICEGENVIIQKGQYYSIVITQKTSDGNYTINTPVGNASEDNKHYDLGIINERESYVKQDGLWNDYSQEEVRKSLFEDPEISKPAYDNFPIKGFCKATGNNIAIRMTGDSFLQIFRGKKYSYKIRFTGSSDAVIPDQPEITWAFSEGGDKLMDIETSDGGAKAVITPKAEGEAYLLLTVKGIGTKVQHLSSGRLTPDVARWHDADENYRPKGAVYTGEPLEPGVDIYVEAPALIELVKDKEYTIEYKNNIKCGAGIIDVVGAGELSQEGFQECFPIIPQAAEIKKVKADKGAAIVEVKDQKTTGISGYHLYYRLKGTDNWSKKDFAADSKSLKLTGLSAERTYEIRAAAYVDIPEEQRGWELSASYSGAQSNTVTVTTPKADTPSHVTKVPATSIKKLKYNKKKKSVTVKWKKVQGVTGYKISYSTNKKFKKSVKTVTVKKAAKQKILINKLKKNKKYYFRIRSYKKIGGKIYYSVWSKKKAIKISG